MQLNCWIIGWLPVVAVIGTGVVAERYQLESNWILNV